jgi:hypothetical protein
VIRKDFVNKFSKGGRRGGLMVLPTDIEDAKKGISIYNYSSFPYLDIISSEIDDLIK